MRKYFKYPSTPKLITKLSMDVVWAQLFTIEENIPRPKWYGNIRELIHCFENFSLIGEKLLRKSK